jgi:hypothetical protein
MVLVSYKPSNAIGILQTKLSNREGHKARRSGLQAMPLDQHIEGRHGEREPRLKILPPAVHDFLEVANNGQHRQDRLDEDAILPLPPSTQFEVGRIPLGGMEGGITQDNHASVELPNQPLEGIVCDIGGGTVPPHDQPPLIEQETEFAADNPAMIGEAFAADLLGAAAFAHGVDQLNAIRVDHPEHGRGGQESPRPVVMRLEEPKEPGALGEVGKQRPIVAR